MRRGRRSIFAWLVAAAAAAPFLAGCSGDSSSPFAPPAPQPPLIAEVFPASRAVSVPYESPIWAQFATPLDPSTVGTRTVFLKIDTRRIPIDVTYDPATHRIQIHPLSRLSLVEVYTVEITPQVRTLGGGALEQTYFWQFITNSVRRIADPNPPTGSLDESPFRTLAWAPTDQDSLHYDVWVGMDSAAVSARTVPLFARVTTPFSVPRARWTFGATYYWTVTVHNRRTGEEDAGPVWRFQVLPDGLPVQTVDITFSEWGFKNMGPGSTVNCNSRTLVSGPTYTCAFRLKLTGLGTLKLHNAVLTMRANVNLPAPPLNSTTYVALKSWSACAITGDAPLEGLALATATQVQDILTYQGDPMTAHIEAALRGLTDGQLLKTPQNITYYTPSEPNPSYASRLTLTYYP